MPQLLTASSIVMVMLITALICKVFYELGMRAGFGMAMGEKNIRDLAKEVEA